MLILTPNKRSRCGNWSLEQPSRFRERGYFCVMLQRGLASKLKVTHTKDTKASGFVQCLWKLFSPPTSLKTQSCLLIVCALTQISPFIVRQKEKKEGKLGAWRVRGGGWRGGGDRISITSVLHKVARCEWGSSELIHHNLTCAVPKTDPDSYFDFRHCAGALAATNLLAYKNWLCCNNGTGKGVTKNEKTPNVASKAFHESTSF